jgi:protein-disulfide isomerase
VPSQGELAPDTVLASFGSEKITVAQVDEQIKMEDKKFQLRKQGLDQLLMEKLVKAEATKKGMTEEQYLKAEIEDKAAPSDKQIEEFFKQNSARLPQGATLEQLKGQIAAYLTGTQRQQRMAGLYEQLRKDYNVSVQLNEPRKQVEAKGPSRGPDKAPVTLVEFSDFQCPFCSKAHDTVEQVMQTYGGKVRLVFRQFPLNFHQNAAKAAEAALCANDQGKFWEYHDVLFKNQQSLEIPQLKEHAKTLGLEASSFQACLDTSKHKKAVDDDLAAGQKVGVNGTPAFFINGVQLSGAVPFDDFKKVIDQELARN